MREQVSVTYSREKGITGHRGSGDHVALMDWSRFDLYPYITDVFPDEDLMCIYDDGLIKLEFNGASEQTHWRKDCYLPDGCWTCNGVPIAIEVGRLQLDTARDDVCMLHVGFDASVHLVNPHNELVIDIANAVKDYVDEFGISSSAG